MTILDITTQEHFNDAVQRDAFQNATKVRLRNLPGVTTLPDMPNATKVLLDDRLRKLKNQSNAA